MGCGESYDSHVWAWVHGRLSCTVCGVEDLTGRRLVQRVLEALRRAGWHVNR